MFLALLLCLGAGKASYGQVILDGPNVSGTVGLNGQTQGGGWLYFYWNDGNLQAQIVNGDTDYSVRVEPDKTLSAQVYLSSFQGGTNAYVYQYLYNITGPASSATTPLQLNLARDAGRILGRVTVTGGSVTRVDISASTTVSANERYNGYATAVGSPYDAILPFVTASGVTVQGTAILRASAGCDVPVTLASRSVSVATGDTAVTTWNFDLTGELCNQASIQGQVTFAGLDGLNADAVTQQRYVQASGPVSRSQTTNAAGSYTLSGLPPGSYYLYNYSYFAEPYSFFAPQGSSVSVAAGDSLTRHFNHPVGTAHGAIRPKGAWSIGDVTQLYANVNSYSPTAYLGQSSDNADPAGNLHFVVPAGGSSRLDYFRPYFFRNDSVRYTYEYFSASYYADFPFQTTMATGDRIDLGTFEPETSESLVVVQPANATVGLASLRLTGSHNVVDAQGSYKGSRSIDLYSYANSTPQNSVAVLVRGFPGTYRMTATGQGTDGATYSKPFDLVLGEPENTPTGPGVVTPIAIVDQTSGASVSGSITFGNVTVTGETTVSASGSGPQAPGNFRVFGAGSMLYYDIQTTAQFDSSGATVCLGYDDSGLNAGREERLTLQHYKCADPQTNTGCAWEDITLANYPDTAANKICGRTYSFSIFALMEPLDQDGDGIADANDNCPAVPNADQDDADTDGLGDRCDSDLDGDGVGDVSDNCVATPNAWQLDLDDDGVGDSCDADLDGDTIVNAQDNCSVNANQAQSDFDGDGLGDACDADDDADGVADAQDSCAGTAPETTILANGCSSLQQLEMMCPAAGTYRNHGQYVQCVAHEAEAQVAAGLITAQEKDAMVATAAKSQAGKK